MIDMQTTKRPDFLAKFPAGCIPSFESTDGTCIQQSAAIAQYGECQERSGSVSIWVLPPFHPPTPPGQAFRVLRRRRRRCRSFSSDEFTTSSYPCLNDFCRQILRRVVSLYF